MNDKLNANMNPGANSKVNTNAPAPGWAPTGPA
jgi:hypothetical protein